MPNSVNRSAHTPGPWRVVEGGICLHVVSTDAGFSTGCISFDGRGLANAHLIAAAPELLDALAVAVRTIRTWHGLGMGANEAQAWALYQASPEMRQITAALAKTEGR